MQCVGTEIDARHPHHHSVLSEARHHWHSIELGAMLAMSQHHHETLTRCSFDDLAIWPSVRVLQFSGSLTVPKSLHSMSRATFLNLVATLPRNGKHHALLLFEWQPNPCCAWQTQDPLSVSVSFSNPTHSSLTAKCCHILRTKLHHTKCPQLSSNICSVMSFHLVPSQQSLHKLIICAAPPVPTTTAANWKN